MRTLAPALLAILLWVPAVAEEARLADIGMVRFERPVQAPAFSLETLSGARTTLAAHRGRVILLNFWATWCPPCVEEMPSIEALYQGVGESDLVVLAISSDEGPAETVRAFIEPLGVTFPVLLDRDGRVSALYGARNLPATFLLDREGRVVAAALGARDWGSPRAIAAIAGLVDEL